MSRTRSLKCPYPTNVVKMQRTLSWLLLNVKLKYKNNVILKICNLKWLSFVFKMSYIMLIIIVVVCMITTFY